MLRSYGRSRSTRRSPNQISPPSSVQKPATSRSSVVLPHAEGPSSVNSSPSPISRLARSTAVTFPNRLRTSRSPIFTDGPGLWLLPGRFDVRAELLLERLRPLLRDVLVVDVGDVAVEVRAHAAGELDGHLGGRAGRSLHLVLRRDREEPALHEDVLTALRQQEFDQGARRLRIARAGQDRHRLGPGQHGLSADEP